jgi:hypothetical protein
MTGRELLKENEGMLRQIIRSIDKNLDYTLIDSAEAQGARFALQLSWRGREATVSLSVDDLKSAGTDLVRKNAIRQKIKHARDNKMDTYSPDVLGKKITRMLAESRGTEESFKRPAFRRPPGRR